MSDAVKITKAKGGIIIEVKVFPRSSQEGVAGIIDGKLKIKLIEPPVDGKANAALIAFLASKLDLRKCRIQILKGESSSIKQIFIHSGDDISITTKINHIASVKA